MTKNRVRPETVLGLIETLYQAVLHPEALENFCSALNSATTSHLGAIFLQDYLRPGGKYLASCGFDQALTERYDRDFAGKNILMGLAERNMRPGLVCVSDDYITASEWSKAEYYNEFVKPQDGFHVAGGCIAYEHGVSAMITFGRSRSAGPFDSSQLDLIRLLLPHLRNVLELQRRVGFLDLRSEIGWQIVDRLQFAVLCVTEAMLICFANERARGLMTVRDGIFERAGRLTAMDRRDSERLNRLCAQCARQEAPRGGAVCIQRKVHRPALTGYVCPIDFRDTPPGLFERPIAIVILTDPSHEPDGIEEALRVYFGITPAEARVAMRIIRGMSLKGIADDLCVSVNTVKSQLKQLMHRTGTTRQSEFVACLLNRMIRLETNQGSSMQRTRSVELPVLNFRAPCER